jgi:hypothetical protein
MVIDDVFDYLTTMKKDFIKDKVPRSFRLQYPIINEMLFVVGGIVVIFSLLKGDARYSFILLAIGILIILASLITLEIKLKKEGLGFFDMFKKGNKLEAVKENNIIKDVNKILDKERNIRRKKRGLAKQLEDFYIRAKCLKIKKEG